MLTAVRFSGATSGNALTGGREGTRSVAAGPLVQPLALEHGDIYFGSRVSKSRKLLWLLPILALLTVQDSSRTPQQPSNWLSQADTVTIPAMPTQPADLFVGEIPRIPDCGCEDDGVRPAKAPEGLDGLAALSAEQEALAEYLRPRVARITVRTESNALLDNLPRLPRLPRLLPSDPPDPPPAPEPRKKVSLGTGWVCQSDGIIVTNHHVIDDALEAGTGKIEVTIGHRVYDAKVIAADKAADLAFLKVETDEPLPTLRLVDEPARQGEVIALMGQPKGLEQIFTIGTVSGVHQSYGGLGLPMFTTDAAVNKGNSGGPGVRPDGGVLGVVVAKLSGSDVDNIGFVIQSRYVNGALKRISEGKSLDRMSLGAMISTPEAVRRYMPGDSDTPDSEAGFLEAQRRLRANPPEEFGAVIVSIVPGSLADRSGQLRVGDVVTAVNGERFESTTQMVGDIKNIFADEPVELTLIRNGRRMTLTLNGTR